ncbi:hypothetical protein ACOMDM_08020 [Serratia plymuthica]|uniref:hypothetical protein n=1 Tax=Serratia plymuthica TaxID=82996 RepID=UPI003B9DF7D4
MAYITTSLQKITPALFLILMGCSSIQLVSNYDETTDKTAADLYKSFDDFFLSKQVNGDESLKYNNNVDFYKKSLVDIDMLETRVKSIYNNSKTIEQVEVMKMNFSYLVLLNKKCVTSPLTEQQKSLVKENGVDLSTSCQKSFGASIDADNRGDVKLNKYTVSPIKDIFNQTLGSIMAFELAKKRGDDIKTSK